MILKKDFEKNRNSFLKSIDNHATAWYNPSVV